MFETSADVLNLIIALCVLIFTFFLVWGLYYLISGLRKVYRVINEMDKVVHKINDTVDLVKSKVKKGGSYLYVLGEATKKIVDLVADKTSKKNTTQTKKTSSKAKNNKKSTSKKK